MAQAFEGYEVIEVGCIRVPVIPGVVTAPILATLQKGKYENARAKCLREMVEPGERIVEVGAGLGFSTALMAQEGRAAKIVAIEGHPGAHAAACELDRLNGLDVERINALAVTESPGGPTRTLYVSEHFWASSMLPIGKGLAAVVEVPVLTFDEIVARHAPTMLVLDLEVTREHLAPGSPSGPLEALALDGVNKVVVHLVHSYPGGVSAVSRIFRFFDAQGFHFDFDHSRGSVVMFSRLPT